MKEFVEKLREKADVFEKSGCSVDGIVKDYRKSADMIEELYEKSDISGFVKKLIKRLEKEQKSYEAEHAWNYAKGLEYAVSIVNQLAEEYNPSKSSSLNKVSQETKTRIDCICSMSVEEMADKILASAISTTIDFCQEFSECHDLNEKGEEIPDEMCKKCLVKWLNSLVEQQKVIPTKHFEDIFNTVT